MFLLARKIYDGYTGWTFSKKDGDFEHKKNLIKKSLPWDSINRIFSGSCK